MPVQNHSLVREFPEFQDRIHQLKITDTHFARLFAEYDAVENDIQRIESGAEPTTDERLEAMKKKRLSLKDTLAGLLHKAA